MNSEPKEPEPEAVSKATIINSSVSFFSSWGRIPLNWIFILLLIHRLALQLRC